MLSGAVDSPVKNKVLEELEDMKENESVEKDKEALNEQYFLDMQQKMREKIVILQKGI